MQPKVFCAYDQMVSIASLKPNPDNPNFHPEEQLRMLAAVLQNGWRLPITVSNRSGFVVRGHGRLEAARRIGCEEAPVDFQDYETEAEELSDLLADNKLPELSDLDASKALDLLDRIKASEIDIVLAGFTVADMEELLAENAKMDEAPDSSKGGKGEKRNLGEKSHQVKPVLYVEQIAIFEQALRATGEMNRGKALIQICEDYLGKRSKKRQQHDPLESLIAQAATL